MLKCLLLFVCMCGCTVKQQTFTGGAVAADHYLASKVGVEILKKGGNAVDAAVATSFALSVVRPFSCGIGGGGFMLIDSPAMEPVALNYRETAPHGVGPNFYQENSSRFGATSVGIPGTVAGLLAAHERFGVLTREQVLMPALHLASKGFKADSAYVNAVRLANNALGSNPEFIALRINQSSVVVGQQLDMRNQHNALKLIMDYGADGFYQGKLAQAIVSATSGHISMQDLDTYTPRWETPLQIAIGSGNVLVCMPPPSSGGVAIAQMIGLLDRLNAKQYEGKPEFTQLLIEAMKHAFADRAEHMADATFVDVPVEQLLSANYLDELASRIVLGKTQKSREYGSHSPPPADDGTSHICVIDGNGMTVSVTETINTSFGSMVTVEPFGFMLNNEMDDFSSPSGENAYGLRQSNKNLPEPNKRPLSSMSPTIVEQDGVPILVLGASGGPRIISSVVQVLLAILWFGDAPVEALTRSRVHHQWLPDVVYVEDKYRDIALENALRHFGYSIKARTNIGVVQVIQSDTKYLKPASDPRKGGKPAGFN